MKPKSKKLQHAFVGALSVTIVSGLIASACAQEKASPSTTSARERIENSLLKMGYEDISLSGCWLKFERTVAPSERNGWTERYVRYENLDNIQGFSQRVVQEIENGGHVFYGLSAKLDEQYLLPLQLVQFRQWVNATYPGANWPDVAHSEQSQHIPDIERALETRFQNLEMLNRWQSFSRFGKTTKISDWFQITWKTRPPLVELKNAIELYAAESACNIEN